MTPEQYEKAGEIYHAALNVPTDRRPQFLDEVCDGDPDLRGEVESLLAAHHRAGQFIEASAMEVAAALFAADETTVTLPGRIGHYDVLSPIARGGMGEVYLARDATLGRNVALKLPHPSLISDRDAVRRFQQEARAASSLNHPNIVTIHEIGEIAGHCFIAMEFVEGQSLATIIGQPLSSSSLARLGRQLAQALAVAHAAGIVHGDIKPQNIMVRSDGYVKVLDFGIASLLPQRPVEGATDMTTALPGVILGTPRYMSPEQTRGETITEASDVFACGVVLYELATGRHPFPADSQSTLWHAITTYDPPPPSREGLRIPRALERLLLRTLEKDPSARPTARDVELELRSIEAALSGPDGHRSRNNLPAQRTRFLGRSSEIAVLEPMLLDPCIRLVTLTGPGGTGKTRLALEIGARMTSRFEGGVSFVNLAPIVDPSRVVPEVARVHGVRETKDRPLVEALCERLRSRGTMLLLLDNFEQVADAFSLISELLDSCPNLTLLVTSRVVLRVYGEHEFRVPPLPVPDRDEAAPERLMECVSVALFVQRAAAVRPEFRLYPGDASAVAEICRRLDGLPLAIELAAARTKILRPQELLARVEHRLELLTGGARDLPARQQTLRGTIDWSYHLLTTAEQTLFRRLSVFRGGCSFEAIEAVCNATEDLGLEVPRAVTALVDNSLLVQHLTDEGECRFIMLETIQEYARERLDQSGETSAIRRAHAAYALVLAEEGTVEMPPAEREAWLRCCDREHDNLRAAIQYLAATGDSEWGFRLGIGLFRFWEQREYLTEGREALTTLLAIPGTEPSARVRAHTLYHAGVLADIQGDYAAAELLHREAHDTYQQVGDRKGVAMTLGALAWQAQHGERYSEARALLEQAAALWDQLGETTAVDLARSNMASVAMAEGNYRMAHTLLEQLLETCGQRNDSRGVASALNALGDLAASQGELDLARRHHHESLARFQVIDDRWGIARALTDLANVDLQAEDYTAATRSLTQALRACNELGHQRGVARRLESLSWCAARQSRHDEAVRFASAAAEIRQRILVPAGPVEREKVEQTVREAQQLLGSAQCARAWEEGHTMSIDQILDSLRTPTE